MKVRDDFFVLFILVAIFVVVSPACISTSDKSEPIARLVGGEIGGHLILQSGDTIYKINLDSGAVVGEEQGKPKVIAWEVKANAEINIGGMLYKLQVKSPNHIVGASWEHCYYASLEMGTFVVGGLIPGSSETCEK